MLNSQHRIQRKEIYIMMRYEIIYKDLLLGVLLINSSGLYKYTPNSANTEKAMAEISLGSELTQPTDWREPIPFFSNRIENAKRFSLEDDIRTQKDFLRMVRTE